VITWRSYRTQVVTLDTRLRKRTRRPQLRRTPWSRPRRLLFSDIEFLMPKNSKRRDQAQDHIVLLRMLPIIKKSFYRTQNFPFSVDSLFRCFMVFTRIRASSSFADVCLAINLARTFRFLALIFSTRGRFSFTHFNTSSQ